MLLRDEATLKPVVDRLVKELNALNKLMGYDLFYEKLQVVIQEELAVARTEPARFDPTGDQGLNSNNSASEEQLKLFQRIVQQTRNPLLAENGQESGEVDLSPLPKVLSRYLRKLRNDTDHSFQTVLRSLEQNYEAHAHRVVQTFQDHLVRELDEEPDGIRACVDRVHRLLTEAESLDSFVRSLAPLEQTPDAHRWREQAQQEESWLAHDGFAIALQLEINDTIDYKAEPWRLVRREIYDAYGLLCKRPPDGFRGCSTPEEEQSISWFFVPRSPEGGAGEGPDGRDGKVGRGWGLGSDADGLLRLLFRIGWGLCTLAPMPERSGEQQPAPRLTYRIFACPCRVRWPRADENAQPETRVRESASNEKLREHLLPETIRSLDAIRFEDKDAAPRVVAELFRDPTIKNVICVHPDILKGNEPVVRWFRPTWRVPYQIFRDREGAQLEWVYTSPTFNGRPGWTEYIDLAAVEPAGRVEWPETTGKTAPGNGKSTTDSARRYRSMLRIELRTPVFCHLFVRGACWDAYLLDYSVLGCRLALPVPRGDDPEYTRQALERLSNTTRPGEIILQVPPGLYWPWRPEVTCSLSDEAIHVRFLPPETQHRVSGADRDASAEAGDDGNPAKQPGLIGEYRWPGREDPFFVARLLFDHMRPAPPRELWVYQLYQSSLRNRTPASS